MEIATGIAPRPNDSGCRSPRFAAYQEKEAYVAYIEQMTTSIRCQTIKCYRTKAAWTFMWRLDVGWTYMGKVWGVPLGCRPKIVSRKLGRTVIAVPVDDSSSAEEED